MEDILQEIIAWKRVEVERMKDNVTPIVIHRSVEQHILASGKSLPSMREALMSSDTGIIAEFKRKSPSKGWINEQSSAEVIPYLYQKNGAAALSILTDEHYFGGSDAFVSQARKSGVTIPVLYKNFIVDEYQLFQARLCGASAVLLIASALKMDECRALLRMAHELGLEVLLEMHHEQELDYAELMPDMYGVNNRHLGTFVTDVHQSLALARFLPEDGCKVSESGISDAQTIVSLRQIGYKGFLIGETFMKTPHPALTLAELIKEIIQ